jgi:hypothetical protein
MNDESGRPEGISLWTLDKLMNGDLPEAEAAALRERIARSPEAARYVETYSAMRADASLRKRVLPDRTSRTPGRQGIFERMFGSGSRNLGVAFASLLTVGIGAWIWHMQGNGIPGSRIGATEAGIEAHGMMPKGLEEVRVRVLIAGRGFEAGEVASARPGDTLGVEYRSPKRVVAQIWFREEGGSAQAMSGEGSLSWPPAASWRPAPVRIVLEGAWRRQTVWVVTSFSAFTPAEAEKALEGGSERPDLRADAVRLAD